MLGAKASNGTPAGMANGSIGARVVLSLEEAMTAS
jgi:hypothetical protein